MKTATQNFPREAPLPAKLRPSWKLPPWNTRWLHLNRPAQFNSYMQKPRAIKICNTQLKAAKSLHWEMR